MKWLLKHIFVTFVTLSFVVCVTSFFLPLWLYGLPGTSSDFEGSFSLANAVVAFFAFTWFIYTLRLQHIELGLQRRELTLQRKEMQRMQQIQLLALRAQLTAKVLGQTNDGRSYSDDELLSFICEALDHETEKFLKETQLQIEAISAIFRVCHHLNCAITSDNADSMGIHLRATSRWADLHQDCKFKSLYTEGNEKTREVLCVASLTLGALEQRLAEGTTIGSIRKALLSIRNTLIEVVKELNSEEAKRNPRLTQKPPEMRKESRSILEAANFNNDNSVD